MKKSHLAVFAALAVFAFSAMSAAPAFAEPPEFLVSGASVSEPNAFHIEITGTWLWYQLALGIHIECVVTGLLVLWAAFALVEEARLSSCKTVAGSCGTPVVEVDNIPWLIELMLVSEMLVGLILSDGAGVPGLLSLCFGLVDELCEKEDGGILFENMPLETVADTLGIFEEPSNATCGGSANTGEIGGELLFLALEGLTLEIDD